MQSDEAVDRGTGRSGGGERLEPERPQAPRKPIGDGLLAQRSPEAVSGSPVKVKPLLLVGLPMTALA